jgi:hypothetical protein
MVLTLVALSLLTDIAPGPFAPKRPPPKQPPPQCTQNSDCVLSTWQGCCPSCCSGPPHAIRKGTKEGEFCAAVDCAMPNCNAVRCARPPDLSSFVAVCRAGTCVAEPKTSQAPAQCQTAQDCKVVNAPLAGCQQRPCGCCPVTQALPIDAVVPLQQRPAEKKSTDGKPNFGLSTGGSSPPQQPNCAPCPAPSGGEAACQSGQCVLVQPPVIRPRPPG